MSSRLPPLASLRAFESAARLASFTQAATEIHVTPSAVSHQIKALEVFLGKALFVRAGRSEMRLTREGEFLAARVSAALGSIREAAETLRASTTNQLTLSVLPSFAARWLMPRIGRFVDAHPGMELNLRTSTAHAEFARDGVDLAIRFGGGSWAGAQSELLLRDELFPVASPQFIRGKKLQQPQALASYALLESDPEGWERWSRVAGIELKSTRRRLDLGDASLTLQAAIDGRGIALARRSIAASELERGTLRRLSAVSVLSQYSYYLVWPAKTQLGDNARIFRRWIKAEIAASA